MTRKIEIDEAWLRKMYCDEGKSAVNIARILGVSMDVVNRRLRDYGIRVRNSSESTSLAQFGSLQVMNFMKDPEWLRAKYVDEKLSTLEIAKLIGVTSTTVFRYISNYGIKLRTPSEARAKHPKSKKQPKTSRRKGKTNQITKTCDYCQKVFNTFPSINAKFCSNSCYQGNKEKPVIFTCQSCEEPFFEYLSELNARRRTGLFCSIKCRHVGGRLERICEHCGSKFIEFKSRIDEGKGIYCSKGCLYSARPAVGPSVIRNCEHCKKEFRVSPGIVERGYGNFCSRRCSHIGENNPQWIGGHTVEYPLVWNREFRMMIRRRDNFKCGLCQKHGFDVHHIDYDKTNCNPENLITLCHSCHAKTNFNRQFWIQVFAEVICIPTGCATDNYVTEIVDRIKEKTA